MIRCNVLLLVCIAILGVPTSGWSKGETVKIVIDGDNLSSPIEIASPDVVRQFNIWNGPGVSTRGPDGVQHPPAYLDPDKTSGRFIDWPNGIATSLPTGMRRLEVTFYIAGRRTPSHDGKYWFAYEIDPENKRGYIFLPRWMSSYISHGVEGNWFYASERWDELMIPAIQEASDPTSDPSTRNRFSCVFGTGLMRADGAIELYRLDDQGNSHLNYRYFPADDLFDEIYEHIGPIAPGDEVEVSCWPPRS